MDDSVSRFGDFMSRAMNVFREDIEAVRGRDPAARDTLEIIMSYPGLHAIWMHRIAHYLHGLGVPLLPRLISMFARAITGIEIHQGARIGSGFFIDHGMGVVIGETSDIGDNVTLFQGVTLGGTGKERGKRHPTIEDNVIIYARSTILGGDTQIGHDSIIGGNVWLTESVQPCSVVYQKSHVIVRDSKDISSQINWVI